MTHPFEPDWTLSPGAMLASHLEDRGMTPLELAAVTGLPLVTVQGVLVGAIRVDEAIATALGEALGVSVAYWLNAQANYDADLARGAKDLSGEHMKQEAASPMAGEGAAGRDASAERGRRRREQAGLEAQIMADRMGADWALGMYE
jgi:plasmid maintenance system antidote protein VapI